MFQYKTSSIIWQQLYNKRNDILMFLLFYFSVRMIEKPEDSVMVKLVVSLLQLSKMAVNHAGEKAVLGKFVSPTDLLGLSLQAKIWNFSSSQHFFPLLFCFSCWKSPLLEWCILFSVTVCNSFEEWCQLWAVLILVSSMLNRDICLYMA